MHLDRPYLSDMFWRRPQESTPACNLSKIEPDFIVGENQNADAVAAARVQNIVVPTWPSHEIPCVPSLFGGSSDQRCPKLRFLDSLLDVELRTDLFPMPNTVQKYETTPQHHSLPPVFFSGTIECQEAITPIPVVDIKPPNMFESSMAKEATRLRQQLVGFAFFENQ